MTADFKTAIVRPTVIYGKDAPGNISNLIKFLKLSPIAPFGYYQNKRSILSVENFTNALYLILTKRAIGVFLLRDKELISIGELVSIIVSFLDKKIVILPLSSLISKVKSSFFSKLFGDLIVDDSKTIEILGEYRVNSLRDSIKKMV
jgi:UDP-glucose 4-epimerase